MAERDLTESSASNLQLADAHERRVSQERNEQFEAMRNQARAVFAAIGGRHGIRSAEDWQRILKQSGIDYKKRALLDLKAQWAELPGTPVDRYADATSFRFDSWYRESDCGRLNDGRQCNHSLPQHASGPRLDWIALSRVRARMFR